MDKYLSRYPRNFTYSEMIFSETAARKGINNECPLALRENLLVTAKNLQKIRNALTLAHGVDMPVTVSSGYRSPILNREVGGSRRSEHMSACAADINSFMLTPFELATFIRMNLLADIPWNQLILEFQRWVHISFPEAGELPKYEVLTTRYVDGVFTTSNGLIGHE